MLNARCKELGKKVLKVVYSRGFSGKLLMVFFLMFIHLIPFGVY